MGRKEPESLQLWECLRTEGGPTAAMSCRSATQTTFGDRGEGGGVGDLDPCGRSHRRGDVMAEHLFPVSVGHDGHHPEAATGSSETL